MASPRSEKRNGGKLRFKQVRVAALLLLLSVSGEGLARPRLPVHLRRSGTGLRQQQVASREWTGRRKAAVSQATTPPHGDYDYAYTSNDGMDHSGSYQQQGGGELGYTGNGLYVTDKDPAVTGAAVAANVNVPAFDDGASRTTGGLTEEIQRRSVSVGQLFGKSAATMGNKKHVSGLEATPPGLLWRAGVKGMVPMAAVVGLSLTPSRYVAARAAGGVVLAIAANVARQAAVATRKRQAPQAMLELLRKEGAGDVTREQLVDLAEKFFVKEPELWASSRFLYSSILTDTVADHRPNSEDLGRLVMLKWTLGLSSQEVASCHHRVIADAVSSLGPPVSMDKMLYLSERMFYQEGTTDAGYLDQCARLRNQLGGMTQVDLLRKVTQYAAPYYQIVLEDVISRPENFSGEVLLRTRRRLGISEVVAGGMHLDVYQLAIQRLLDANGKLEEGDRVWLSRLRGIMSVSQFEGERALESVTAPIYREVVQAAFVEVAELHWGQPGVDALRSKLRSRQGDLQLSMAAADAVVKETIRKLALRSLEVALFALRNSGGESSKAEVLRSMSEVFRLKEAAALLVQKSPNADCSRYFLGVLVGSPSLRLAESEKRTIYRMHLENALKDMRLDEEDKATLAELRGMLQLVEADTRQVYVSVVNPLLSARLAGMMEHGDFASQDVAKLEEDLTVPHETFLDICMEAYHTKLTKLLERSDIAHGASSMPSDIEKAALDSAAEALGLSREQLYTIHDITCGPAFKAAALDLLTAAEAEVEEGLGQQAEPVVVALEALRTRLGMSTDGARAAFVEAFFEVSAPKVKKVSVAIEELKDARKVMPATMGMPTIPLPAGRAGTGSSSTSALAAAGGPNGDDRNSIVARALAAPGAGPGGTRGGEAKSMAAAAAVEGQNGNDLSHVEKLERRAAEIMEQVLGLASFCERAGASKELEVVLTASSNGRSDPLYSADIGQTMAPRPALLVYTFFLEEGFSPSRDSLAVDDPIVQQRDSLALVLGLSKARVIDVHRGAASRLYLDFLQGKLQQKWTLEAVDIASLKAMEEALGMTRVVCEELLARGKKSFVRGRVEESGARAMDDPPQARRLRLCADNLGISLRDDLALPEERRRRMFEAEARGILADERDAAAAKSALESICSSLGLHDGAVYDLYAKLRNAPEMQQNSGLEDGTVIVVKASRSLDGHLGSDRSDKGGSSGGVVGGDGGFTSPPAAFVTSPAAYATSE